MLQIIQQLCPMEFWDSCLCPHRKNLPCCQDCPTGIWKHETMCPCGLQALLQLHLVWFIQKPLWILGQRYHKRWTLGKAVLMTSQIHGQMLPLMRSLIHGHSFAAGFGQLKSIWPFSSSAVLWFCSSAFRANLSVIKCAPLIPRRQQCLEVFFFQSNVGLEGSSLPLHDLEAQELNFVF